MVIATVKKICKQCDFYSVPRAEKGEWFCKKFNISDLDNLKSSTGEENILPDPEAFECEVHPP